MMTNQTYQELRGHADPTNPSDNCYKEIQLKSYDAYRRKAADPTLSRHEKIGYPDSYREGKAEVIFADIRRKLPALDERGKTIVDIGCGCDELAERMIACASEHGHALYLIDSPEMLALLPDTGGVRKTPGKFPQEQGDFVEKHRGGVDVVLAYSMLMGVCTVDNIFNFVDRAVELLAPGGHVMLGDLANRSKRHRFFRSPEGIRTHREYVGDPAAVPDVDPWELEYGTIDDALVIAMVMRYRAAGFETYILPQDPSLPVSNRREDILIEKRR